MGKIVEYFEKPKALIKAVEKSFWKDTRPANALRVMKALKLDTTNLEKEMKRRGFK